MLSELLTPGLIDDKNLPSCIRAVLRKHSTPGGTLCGKIPTNTFAKGFQAHIELEHDAGAVNVKRLRYSSVWLDGISHHNKSTERWSKTIYTIRPRKGIITDTLYSGGRRLHIATTVELSGHNRNQTCDHTTCVLVMM